MITKQPFGTTGHASSRIIFGAYALKTATQAEADGVLELLLEHGVNHIDAAPMYGNAERRVGRWMEGHRDSFFVATKTRSRTYEGAWKDLRRSLDRLRIDCIDLWQIHGLTGPQGWERAMGPGGTLEAFLEARDSGLVRFLGVTGHGLKAAAMHARSLERFPFDAVMSPYSYALMQSPCYAADFHALADLCRERGVALQTIKSVARQAWGERPKAYNTDFYEPLVDQDAVDLAVHWVLGNRDAFLITAGDMRVLPRILAAAECFRERPSDADMAASAAANDIRPIFV
jgi:aryl-alcohol dehydrogenase-like predicted oxidoreductase